MTVRKAADRPFVREASFDFHGQLFVPFCTVGSVGINKLLASLTGMNNE